MTRLALILASTRDRRFADKPAQWATDRLGAIPDVEVDLIDLRDHPLPYYEGPAPALNPRDYRNDEVARFAARIDAADGFIVLMSEYNHGYPGVLKNAMDFTFVEWRRKPIAFIGWGNVGGARAIEQLRLVAVEFELAPLRHSVHILPDVMMASRQNPDLPVTELFAPLNDRFTRMVDDLLWWTDALTTARGAGEDGR